MLTLSSPQVVQETVLRWKKEQKVAFVPTMGALHSGHLSLVELAKKYGNRVIVSIFVNPLQFGPTEDLAAYPRTWEDDLASCAQEGVSLVFAPTTAVMYPDEPLVTVQALVRTAHERLVDGAPWLWIVHDLNPRAMSRRVRGFTPAQSWFQDLTTVEVQ